MAATATGAVEGEPLVDPISPDLAAVPLRSDRLARAEANLLATADRLRSTTVLLEDTEADLGRLTRRSDRVAEHKVMAEERRAGAAASLSQARAALSELAVLSYVHGGDPTELAPSLELDRASEELRERRLTSYVAEHQVRDELRHLRERSTAEKHLALANQELRLLRGARTRALRTRATAITTRDRLVLELFAARDEVLRARSLAPVVGLDLPLVALDAYARAAQATAQARPACGIQWWGLAAIGATETRHGSYGAAELTFDGLALPRIVGIALTGEGGTAHVGDTDGGALDGDAVLDRAVGPMQFIPSSWRSYATDGNDDGRADPDNLYDAARSAAELLCRRGPPGQQDMGAFAAAVRHYNVHDEYLRVVLERAARYAAFRIPPPAEVTPASSPPPTG